MRDRLNFFGLGVFLIILILFGGLSNFGGKDDHRPTERQRYAMYIERINNLVKEYDFYKGYLNDGVITLYDAFERKVIDIEFKNHNTKYPLLYFRKDGDNIYYIRSGAVDDEFGIMFINGDANSALDGVANLERCGGNSYYYDTMMYE